MKYLSYILIIISFLFSSFAYPQLVSDFRVNDDSIGNYQIWSKIGMDKESNFIIVWNDSRIQNKMFVFGQLFDKNGVRKGYNFKINQTDSISWYPSIAVSKSGKFAVVWRVENISFRLFNKDGIPLTNDIFLCDTIGCNSPDIACDNQGNFIVVWQVNDRKIRYQKLDSNGVKIGNNIMVEDSSLNYTKGGAKITIKNDNSFIITWVDERPSPFPNSTYDIYMQMFNSIGNKIGSNRRVNDDGGEYTLQFYPSISSDSIGNFIIVWADSRVQMPIYDIYCQLYDKNGVTIGNNFMINELHYNWENTNPIIKIRNNGDFVVGWSGQHPDVRLPYFQRFRSGGIPFGGNRLLTQQALTSEKYYSAISFYNDKIISSWGDKRNEGAGDIYCNIISYQNPDSTVGIVKISNEVPKDYKLFQNFPNPFNNISKIKYQISKSEVGIQKSEVRIVIFDILGKEITTLVKEQQSPGTYEISFEGNNYSTGIYFYSLYINNELLETKKMLLMK